MSPLEILTTTSGLLTGSPYAVPQVGLNGGLEVDFQLVCTKLVDAVEIPSMVPGGGLLVKTNGTHGFCEKLRFFFEGSQKFHD